MKWKLMGRLLVVLVAFSLVAAACGDDDSDNAALEAAQADAAAAEAEAAAAEADAAAAQAEADSAAAEADAAAAAAAEAEAALAAAMAEAEADEGVDPAVVAELEEQLAAARDAATTAEARAEEAAAEAEAMAEQMAAEEAAATTTVAPEPEESTTVRVTSLGLCNEVSVFWARDKGIFAANGIEVELVRTQGGAGSLAAIIGGSADAAFTNAFSTIIAYNQGFPISWIATAYNTTEEPLPVASAVIAGAPTGIEGPQDLVRKRIGVNELGGVNQIVTSVWLRKNGVDPTEVNFVALPFPELVPAVVSGRLDAAQVPLSMAARAGDDVVILEDPYREGTGKVVFAGYVVTNDWLEANPETARAFLASLEQANAELLASEERFEVMAANCPVPAAALANQAEQEYKAPVDFELMNKIAGILVDEGILGEAPDLDGLIPEWSRL
jgi:ABC-type nitrate/sulfonate/bicarbonate transport system substrate-binding protein